MRRMIVMVGGAAAGLAVACGVTVGVGSGFGHAAPGDTNSTLNVVGEQYARAVAILRAQGVLSTFGGSVGSDVPQAQCIVASEKVLGTTGKIQLNLDCTAEAQPQPATASTPSAGGAAGTEGAARPTPGAPGVVTVVPKPVG